MQKKGFGLRLVKKEFVDVFTLNDTLDMWYSNEIDNDYHWKIMARMAHFGNEIKLPQQRIASKVYREEVLTLSELAKKDPEVCGSRHKRWFQKVLAHYKTVDTKKIGNKELHEVSMLYAQMRTGIIHSYGLNELTTAIDAIKMGFKKSLASDKPGTEGLTWCFPFLLLLNEHIAHFTGFPPIRYHVSYDHDRKNDGPRNQDTKLIWIKKQEAVKHKKKSGMKRKRKSLKTKTIKFQIAVERREAVQEQLLLFLNKHRGRSAEMKMPEGADGPSTTTPASNPEFANRFNSYLQNEN